MATWFQALVISSAFLASACALAAGTWKRPPAEIESQQPDSLALERAAVKVAKDVVILRELVKRGRRFPGEEESSHSALATCYGPDRACQDVVILRELVKRGRRFPGEEDSEQQLSAERPYLLPATAPFAWEGQSMLSEPITGSLDAQHLSDLANPEWQDKAESTHYPQSMLMQDGNELLLTRGEGDTLPLQPAAQSSATLASNVRPPAVQRRKLASRSFTAGPKAAHEGPRAFTLGGRVPMWLGILIESVVLATIFIFCCAGFYHALARYWSKPSYEMEDNEELNECWVRHRSRRPRHPQHEKENADRMRITGLMDYDMC